jgi:hypothetical protein
MPNGIIRLDEEVFKFTQRWIFRLKVFLIETPMQYQVEVIGVGYTEKLAE